jgi:predicted nucleic acid-binding Zn ribbon protein
MYCNSCGKELVENTTVCSKCGSTMSKKKSRSNSTIITISVIVLVLVFSFIGVISTIRSCGSGNSTKSEENEQRGNTKSSMTPVNDKTMYKDFEQNELSYKFLNMITFYEFINDNGEMIKFDDLTMYSVGATDLRDSLTKQEIKDKLSKKLAIREAIPVMVELDGYADGEFSRIQALCEMWYEYSEDAGWSYMHTMFDNEYFMIISMDKDSKDVTSNKTNASDSSNYKTQTTTTDKILKIALHDTFKPMEYVNQNGELVGFDVDLARAIAREMGASVEFYSTDRDGFPYVLVSATDVNCIMSTVFIDDKWKDYADFTDPYLVAGDQEIVIAVEKGNTELLDDLNKALLKLVGGDEYINIGINHFGQGFNGFVDPFFY